MTAHLHFGQKDLSFVSLPGLPRSRPVTISISCWLALVKVLVSLHPGVGWRGRTTAMAPGSDHPITAGCQPERGKQADHKYLARNC